jgi:hypothetical protein
MTAAVFKALAAVAGIVPGWLWALILAGALAHGHVLTVQRDAARKATADLRADVNAQQLTRERELAREVARLIGITNNLNEAHHAQLASIDRLERSAVDSGLRVTKAERAAAIAAGSAEAVRHHATVAGDLYSACRDEYRALGYDAARVATTAHTLKAWVDAWPPAAKFDQRLKDFTHQLKDPAP